MTPVSVLIISFNEERYIARCLHSIAWADEIVVVDSNSTDRTPEICMAKGEPWSGKVRLIQRPWPGFREQRNFALGEAKHDWVLVMDSDEEASPELSERLRALLATPGGPPCRAYKIRRYEYFLGQLIRHGAWNPCYQDRFFHREGVRYVNDIHEYPVFQVEPERIHEPIHHSPDFNPEKFLTKMNKYTTIEAVDRINLGQRTNWFRILTAFPFMFYRSFFYYRGYRDGIFGMIVALLEGVSRVVRHIKIWQFTRPGAEGHPRLRIAPASEKP